ncbi:hemerythrin domain-containing protein [Flavisolibacter ginsenosidimutans]|uniref:Hemerythrin domain-containing protein n=1 Tax=Flavisolibacter ginsenosidimutans TaxID=661481 RepID=A0A5B8UHF3_9BACT|nr:hemerythrin domain-containing protein [Flavisolibacter ginsenosidimutans]QEC55766.1 hemerythrin domain-containing protein [Flavisolibacter ginsenosidimutans]
MNEEKKPIKRSKELTPLSKEHHEGLLFGWKIKQGLKNGTDHALIARYIQWFWDNDLQMHFRKEEAILAPHLSGGNEWVQRMFADHAAIKVLVEQCAKTIDENSFIKLADAVHDHIRFEERILFPYAEKEIPAETLAAMFEELNKIDKKATWEDEFWMRK